jgi:hypothetical protein
MAISLVLLTLGGPRGSSIDDGLGARHGEHRHLDACRHHEVRHADTPFTRPARSTSMLEDDGLQIAAPSGRYADDMRSFHEGQLVTLVGEEEALDGIVVHAPSLVKVEVAVPDSERGPVFRTVHPKLLRERTAPSEHDDTLERLIRRTSSGSRRGPRAGAGSARRGHSQASGHRTTGK